MIDHANKKDDHLVTNIVESSYGFRTILSGYKSFLDADSEFSLSSFAQQGRGQFTRAEPRSGIQLSAKISIDRLYSLLGMQKFYIAILSPAQRCGRFMFLITLQRIP